MKNTLLLTLAAILMMSGCKRYSKYEGVPFKEKEPRDWENPELTGLNTEKPHATMISFPDEQSGNRCGEKRVEAAHQARI